MPDIIAAVASAIVVAVIFFVALPALGIISIIPSSIIGGLVIFVIIIHLFRN